VTSSFDVDPEVALRLKGNAENQPRFKDERSKSSVFDTEGEPARQRRVHS
jgi:hypothetical protein